MNRHLVKAKRKDTGDWVVGYYRCQPNFKRERHLIQTYKENLVVEIDFNTLCRNTGHPNNIYEGDEVKSWYEALGVCLWNEEECQWAISPYFNPKLFIPLYKSDDWRPTGKNIHD